MKNRVNIPDFVKASIARSGEDADCVMLVAVSDGKIVTSLAGVDKFCISPDCVALVSAVNDVLENNLFAANAISKMLKKDGHPLVSKREEIIKTMHDAEEEATNDGDEGKKDDALSHLGDALKAISVILNDIEGGATDDEDDD